MRWWDVTVGKQDFRLDGHSDYVRSAAVSPSSPDTWATAGYDHICKLWDVRSQECTMSLDHGAPIEDVKFFPSGDGQGLVTVLFVPTDKFCSLGCCAQHWACLDHSLMQASCSSVQVAVL